MISIPQTDTLLPQVHRLSSGRKLYCFPSATELVKIDFLTEAGSAYQSQPLVAAAANKLFSVASERMDAEQLSEFFDFRGILVESNNTVLQSSATFYTLSRHLGDLLPVLDDLVHAPAFPEREFDVYRRERHQKIMASQQKSSDMARFRPPSGNLRHARRCRPTLSRGREETLCGLSSRRRYGYCSRRSYRRPSAR